jgi:hypothetical protein
MITSWPTPVGTLKELHSSDTGFCGHTMLQHDFEGKALFVHHNQLKSGLLRQGENFQFAKASIVKGAPVKSVPVIGLRIANRATVLPCLDLRGPEDPNIDDPTCEVCCNTPTRGACCSHCSLPPPPPPLFALCRQDQLGLVVVVIVCGCGSSTRLPL